MFYLLSISLIGISFSPLIPIGLDTWQSQELWMRVWIMILFSWSFFEKPKRVQIVNKPLALLFMWVSVSTIFLCYKHMLSGKTPIPFFVPYFNFLCMLIFYKVISEHLTRRNIEKILVCLKYVITVTLITCVLQYFNIGQFFELISDDMHFNNLVSGYIGNGTHLSGFIASCIPLYLYKLKREDWLALCLLSMILSMASTRAHDPAISGYIVSIAVLFYYYKTNFTVMSVFTVIGIIGSIIILPKLPNGFFNPQGRIGLWEIYFNLFKQVPLTGAGLGAVRRIAPHTPIPTGKHLHFELLHFTFELGLIGCLLITNLIKGFLEVKAGDKLELTLKAMFIGFLVSSCFTYPAHLWLPATFAVFSYASLFAIKNGENYGK